MSDQVERKLLHLLVDPRESPYGNPIPGLDEIGGEAAGAFRHGVVTLTSALDAGMDGGLDGDSDAGIGIGHFVVRRLGEPLQTDIQVLSDLARTALRPGRRVAAQRTGDTIRVEGDGGVVELPYAVAQHVFVDAPVVAISN
jgi:DtxR family Mn-dependent transcriptional regulator